jgi:signal transduction histidine kinase/ActR/RegA family two-component response regulator
MRGLRENARTIRALIATAVAVALATLLFNFERENTDAQAETIKQFNGALWVISELNFESQRLLTAMNGLQGGLVSHEEVKLRFDVLWSRIDVVLPNRLGADTGDHELVAEFRRFRQDADPQINSDAPPDVETVKALSERLNDLTLKSRQLWIGNFGAQNPANEVRAQVMIETTDVQPATLALFLLALLLSYIVAEVFFANRGQKREQALRIEAAGANEAKTRFLANVSHEIRTPLNGILGMASELSETELSGDQMQCLRVIEQSGEVLLGTINDVLDLSRIEAGQLLVNEAPYHLRDLVQASCELYSARAREKGLTLTLQVQENLPEVVVGDEVRIRQVLHNLVANAVKFTPSGGVSVRVQPDFDGQRLVIAVQDSGPGIDRTVQKLVFEPFQQADASVTRQHGGSGLGLSISRQLCHAMAGDLSVVSRLGYGATFFFELPLKPASAMEIRQTVPQPQEIADISHLNILVADDNATNRLILSRFLRVTGANVAFAATGEEALTIHADQGFDVILMDVQMPIMDGVAATRRIREEERRTGRAATFIVAVTANVLGHQVSEYRAAGLDEVLGKPVSKRDLLAVLSKHAHRMAA